MNRDEHDIDLSTQSVATLLTAGVVLFVLFLAGPAGGVDFTGEPARLGDGNASVTVVEPETDRLSVEPGRFGTNATYVRLPDVVLDVDRVRGNPRVVSLLTVPNLSIDTQARRYIDSPGRLTIPMGDRALPNRPQPGSYEGTMVIRIQSFGFDEVVLERTLEVTVE